MRPSGKVGTGAECWIDTSGERRRWTWAWSHSVTSLEKVAGGDRSDLTKAGSGIWRTRGVSEREAR